MLKALQVARPIVKALKAENRVQDIFVTAVNSNNDDDDDDNDDDNDNCYYCYYNTITNITNDVDNLIYESNRLVRHVQTLG